MRSSSRRGPTSRTVDVHCSVTSPVYPSPSRPIKPCAAMSTHHYVDHHSVHGDVDQVVHATVGWNRSVIIPALFQPIYGVGQSYEDTERRYGPGWAGYALMMMMMVMMMMMLSGRTNSTRFLFATCSVNPDVSQMT